jgi:uncharacterized protein YndB with AHSA1/START domain
MQDFITREIVVRSPKEKVYAAITDPAQIISWFPDAVEEGSLEVGQQPIFVFNGGKHKTRVHVEKKIPNEYFSYRWVPGAIGSVDDVLSVPNTLVEFFIEELPEGTKITVKESGFTSLPSGVAEKCFTDNTGGWEYMMNRLDKVTNIA